MKFKYRTLNMTSFGGNVGIKGHNILRTTFFVVNCILVYIYEKLWENS